MHDLCNGTLNFDTPFYVCPVFMCYDFHYFLFERTLYNQAAEERCHSSVKVRCALVSHKLDAIAQLVSILHVGIVTYGLTRRQIYPHYLNAPVRRCLDQDQSHGLDPDRNPQVVLNQFHAREYRRLKVARYQDQGRDQEDPDHVPAPHHHKSLHVRGHGLVRVRGTSKSRCNNHDDLIFVNF